MSLKSKEVAALSLNDLLGAPELLVDHTKALKAFKASFVGPKAPKITLTDAEKKERRNEAQRALRSTPEGRAYANAASKKSIALRKEKIAKELEELKAKVAALMPVEPPVVVVEEAAPTVEPVVEEAPAVVTKKAPKKSSKKVGAAE